MFADRFRLSAGGVYLFMNAWAGLASALIMAAYALYYITVARLDPLQLVLVGTALELSYFLCEIPTGVLADTFSRRLSVILGLAIVGVAWAGQGLVPTFIAIAAFELLRGLGEAFLDGATEAWVAGEVGDDALDALFLRETQVTQAIGFLGLPIGVVLALIDLRIPIVLGGLLLVTLAVVLVLVMPERRHPRTDPARTWRRTVGTARTALWSVRTSALLVALLGVEFFWGAASEGYDRLWEAHLLLDLGFPPVAVPAVVAFAILSLAGTVVVIVTAQLARRRVIGLDERHAARALLTLQVVRIGARAAFAVAPSVALALVPFFVESMVRAVFGPLYRSWLIRRTQEGVRATVLSTTSVANALGQVGGGPVTGLIGRSYGIGAAILSTAVLLAPATLFLARATSGRDRSPEASAGE